MQYFPYKQRHQKLALEEHQIRQPLNQKSNKILSSSYLKNFKKNISTKKNKDYPYQENSRESSRDQDGKHNQNLHHLLNQTDNSMQEMLDSSINHFEKVLIQQGNNHQTSLEEQNNYLRCALHKLKIILKEKLQNALKKQKEQLSKMLQDYIALITKLLQDKEQLTISLHDLQTQQSNFYERFKQQHQQRIREQIQQNVRYQYQMRLKSALMERDQQISLTRNQIDQFLEVINQYEEQAKQQSQKYEVMQAKINQLETSGSNRNEDLQNKIEAQSSKIQTLLELLQKAQDQSYLLREQLNKKDNSKDLNEKYQARIKELREQHQQQFLEYQKAIKQTLAKKDQCISRLTLVIEGLRSKKYSIAQ